MRNAYRGPQNSYQKTETKIRFEVPRLYKMSRIICDVHNTIWGVLEGGCFDVHVGFFSLAWPKPTLHRTGKQQVYQTLIASQVSLAVVMPRGARGVCLMVVLRHSSRFICSLRQDQGNEN